MTPAERAARAAALSLLASDQIEVLARYPIRPHEARSRLEQDRREAVRALIQTIAPGEPPTRGARAAAEALRRYVAAGWLRDRLAAPVGGGDRLRALHRLAQLQDGVPLAWRRLYDLAAGQDCKK